MTNIDFITQAITQLASAESVAINCTVDMEGITEHYTYDITSDTQIGLLLNILEIATITSLT